MLFRSTIIYTQRSKATRQRLLVLRTPVLWLYRLLTSRFLPSDLHLHRLAHSTFYRGGINSRVPQTHSLFSVIRLHPLRRGPCHLLGHWTLGQSLRSLLLPLQHLHLPALPLLLGVVLLVLASSLMSLRLLSSPTPSLSLQSISQMLAKMASLPRLEKS